MRSEQNGPNWEAVLSYLAAGQVVVGVDEVGRGAWAGPVVAGAVVLPPGLQLPGLADSKLLSAPARRRLDRQIRAQALAVGLGWVAPAEVDAQGLSWAVRQSGLRALAELVLAGGLAYDLVVLDGKHNYLAGESKSMALVKADALVTPVAAASVVAKVARDRYMELLARRYVGYGFERHVGYGTAMHRATLAESGVSALHRRSVRPVAALVSAAEAGRVS